MSLKAEHNCITYMGLGAHCFSVCPNTGPWYCMGSFAACVYYIHRCTSSFGFVPRRTGLFVLLVLAYLSEVLSGSGTEALTSEREQSAR